MGYVWPVVGRRSVKIERIDGLIGRYSFDASTPLTADSYGSAYWSAQSVLAATHAVLGGERAAFALCRPPGHHAGADYLGGYCYLNTAAIAAQAAIDAGRQRVAILDVDYHHGNGTQDIFWDRSDVFYASVHADPATDYPFYWGHADEVGEGAGLGTTLNLPLPQGAGLEPFRRAQATALEAIARFAPDLLIVSLGVDTWEGDPISHFKLTTGGLCGAGGGYRRLRLADSGGDGGRVCGRCAWRERCELFGWFLSANRLRPSATTNPAQRGSGAATEMPLWRCS